MHRVALVILVGCAPAAGPTAPIGNFDSESTCLAPPKSGNARRLHADMERTSLRLCIEALPEYEDGHPVESCTTIELGATKAIRTRARSNPLPLGSHAQAALGNRLPMYSDDGAMLSIDGTVWDLARDRQLKFQRPAEVSAADEMFTSFIFIDRTVIGTWMPCSGPCEISRVFRRDGTLVIDGIDGVVRILSLGPHRMAAFKDALEIYDIDAAKLRTRVAFLPPDFDRVYMVTAGNPPSPDPLVELATGDVVAAAYGATSIEVVVVNPETGRIHRRVHLPVCGT